jgi:hypothetical protein
VMFQVEIYVLSWCWVIEGLRWWVFDIRCYILYYYYYILLLLYLYYYYIIHYYILYYTYTIILLLYTILFSSSSHLSSSFPFFSSSVLSSPIFILYLSVLTYTYLYSSLLPNPPNPNTTILTPHKLSEGCLEWWMVISIGFWFMF